ncbi:MAG: hypothetical protein Ta2B_09120 [Termitinemataceae bacterium]|nr:MAG: hypothetical protein Ta2B_09120 [Termitinemataceae bacterium]
MHKYTFKKIAFIYFFGLLASNVFAGGGREPMLDLRTPSETSRLILLDWSAIQKPDNFRFGLYRLDRNNKTYELMLEVDTLIRAVHDTQLTPPLANYFYRIEVVSAKKELPQTRPMKISESQMEKQIASAYFVDANMMQLVEANNAVVLPSPGSRGSSGGSTFVSPYPDLGLRGTLPSQDDPVKKKNANKNTEKLNDGIYIGVVGFSGNVANITQSKNGSAKLVPLDPSGRQELLEYLRVSYVQANDYGTALYYAEHKALANLTEMDTDGLLPSNIDSVTFITFTDGTDTSSTDAAFTPIENRDFRRSGSGNAYKNYIRTQLANRKIAGKKINAWSIGIRGKDVINENEFIQTLDSLSSNEGTYAELDEVNDIESSLCEIADGLNIYTPQNDLTFSTPAYPIGTNLRLTFDSSCEEPEAAQYYVDAKVSWVDEQYVLTGLSAEGITLDSNVRVTGKRSNTQVNYTIKLNNDFAVNSVRQWYRQPSDNSYGWLKNSEFASSKTASFSHDRKSAIIYLVLDNSSSLKTEEIDKVRYAISTFVDRLYIASEHRVEFEKIGKEEIKRSTQVSKVQQQKNPPQNNIVSGTSSPIDERPRISSGDGFKNSVDDRSGKSVSMTELTKAPQTVVVTQSNSSPSNFTVPPSTSVQNTYFPIDSSSNQYSTTNSSSSTTYQMTPVSPPGNAAVNSAPYSSLPPGTAVPPPYSAMSTPPYSVPSASPPQPYSPAPPVQAATYQTPSAATFNSPPSYSYQNNNTLQNQYVPPSQFPQSSKTEYKPLKPVAAINLPPEKGFWIQVASYQDLAYAQKSWKTITDFGFHGVEIFEKSVDNRIWYRVKIGPFYKETDAEYALSVLKTYSQNYYESFIVSE